MANKLKHHGTNTTLVSTSEMYSRIISNIGDINLLIDLKGKILKINLPNKNINKNLNSWLNKNIFDFLTIESKEKLDLQITSLTEINILSTKGFELNHVSTDTGEFPVRYKGFKTEDKKNIILIGNDLSQIAEVQKRFVNSQLALEREYSKFRSFETKYKALIEFSEEALVILDASLGNILDLNNPAAKLLKQKKEKLIGINLSKIFNYENEKEFIEKLKSDKINKSDFVYINEKNKNNIILHSSVFRAENEICIIVRLEKTLKEDSSENEFINILNKFYEKTRDGIVFTNKMGIIKYVNDSFLSLCKSENQQLIVDRPFSEFLARGIVDLKVLIEATLENGSTMPFKTQLISNFDIRTDIEISSTYTSTKFGEYICFIISYKPNENEINTSDNVVSEKATRKITKLVGSAPLKDLVADTSDIVEKICIETALEMTKNNRVATAEMLHLSRQSLYVKLRKHNLL